MPLVSAGGWASLSEWQQIPVLSGPAPYHRAIVAAHDATSRVVDGLCVSQTDRILMASTPQHKLQTNAADIT